MCMIHTHWWAYFDACRMEGISWGTQVHRRLGRWGGIFHVRVGAVFTQHSRGWGGIFHVLCWACVNIAYGICVVLCFCCLCCFPFVLCCVVLCCFPFVLCCVVLCCVVLCCVVLCFVVCVAFLCVMLCCVVFFLCCVVLCCVVLCCDLLFVLLSFCVVLCCVVLFSFCVVLCCFVLCCVVICCLCALVDVGRGGGIFHLCVGVVLTQHSRGWGGYFSCWCWPAVLTGILPITLMCMHEKCQLLQHNRDHRESPSLSHVSCCFLVPLRSFRVSSKKPTLQKFD